MVGTAEEIGQDLIETLSTMFHTVMHLSLDLPHEFIPINEQDIEILKQQIASQDYGMSVLAVNLGLTTYEALGINDQINPK